MITKTLLLAGALALGLGACNHQKVNTPGNNNYGTSADDQTPGAKQHSYTSGDSSTDTAPKATGTGQTGAAGIKAGSGSSASGTGAAANQNQTNETKTSGH
jgi:hypothetical protein